jgi:hypothetical protein
MLLELALASPEGRRAVVDQRRATSRPCRRVFIGASATITLSAARSRGGNHPTLPAEPGFIYGLRRSLV